MILAPKLRVALSAIASLVYPEVCQCCGVERATTATGFVGDRCREQVHRIFPPFCDRCGLPFSGAIHTDFVCANCQGLELNFSRARSAVAAKGVVLEVIHRFKYRGDRWFEPFLGELLLEAAVPALLLQEWDLIVPVPLHRLREREREFNQAELLARYLARATKIPLEANILRRQQNTRTQTRLAKADRAANVRGAFSCLPGVDLAGSRVVLIDDVFTTGATTDACARALRSAGATEVCVWTVARGLLQ